MKSNPFLLPLAACLCLAAVLLCWRQFSSRHVSFRPSAGAGEVIFGETARLVGGGGNILLISRPLAQGEGDATAAKVTAFKETLGRQPAYHLAVEWAPPPPNTVIDLGAITQEDFLSAVDKHPDAKALVIFAGLPGWSQELADKVSSRSLQVVAVCGYGPNVRRWLETKSLAIAVVPRLDDPPASAAAPKTPKDWFDREYQMVTPANLAQMPY